MWKKLKAYFTKQEQEIIEGFVNGYSAVRNFSYLTDIEKIDDVRFSMTVVRKGKLHVITLASHGVDVDMMRKVLIEGSQDECK